MSTLSPAHTATIADPIAETAERLGSEHVFLVGVHAEGRLQSRRGRTTVLDHRLADYPGRGPQALRDLLPTFPANPLFVLADPGHDPEYLRQCLHLLPRGAGAVLIAVDTAHRRERVAALRDQLILWHPEHRAEVLDAPDGAWLLVRPPRRVHVTLLMERYSHTYGKSGPSVNWDNLYCSLEQTGLATYSTVLYDERYQERRPYTAGDFAPPAGVDDHALVCIYDFANDHNPPLALLEQAKRAGSKVAYVWLDTRILQHDHAYSDVADCNVMLDATEFDLPRAWPVFTPKNPAWFHDPGRMDPEWQRPIDVSVLGEMRFLKQRKDLLPRLQQEQRLNIYAPGSSATDTSRRLSNEEYARVMQRSKISLALTKDRVRQLKGRLIEVPLCGAMLLADINPYVDRYFEPFREYVPFRDYEDMIRLCRYYLDKPAEREAIAMAGSRKANRFYSARVFWQSLFARLFGRPISE